jgi:hypothetical protein
MKTENHLVRVSPILLTFLVISIVIAQEPCYDKLLLLAKASQVKCTYDKGTTHFEYRLKTHYPALSLISNLNQQLKSLGWEPLRYNIGSEALNSHVTGWSKYIDGTTKPKMFIHQWAGQWINERNEVVSYILKYKYPQGDRPNFGTLQVDAFHFSSERVISMKRDVQAPQTSGVLDTPNTLQSNAYRNELNAGLRAMVEGGDSEGVITLLNARANPNAVDGAGYSVLMLASHRGYTAIVQSLVEYGADVNLTADRGNTALSEAVENGHLQVVKLLLQKGAKVDVRSSKKSLVQLARERGYSAIADLLIEAGSGEYQK